MEGYMWLILISMLGVGILFGFVIGRSKGDVSAPKVRELEKDLHQAKEQLQTYRSEVTTHFEKTATLFNQLTKDYREVYEHLATSSNKLCGTDTAKLKSLTADKNVLEGERQATDQDQSASGAAAAQQTPANTTAADAKAGKAAPHGAEEAAPQPPKKPAAETPADASAGTAAKKDDGSPADVTTASPKEGASSEEAPRTIH
jgi:hypothetical protein